jgi:hypothetical protein
MCTGRVRRAGTGLMSGEASPARVLGVSDGKTLAVQAARS